MKKAFYYSLQFNINLQFGCCGHITDMPHSAEVKQTMMIFLPNDSINLFVFIVPHGSTSFADNIIDNYTPKEPKSNLK